MGWIHMGWIVDTWGGYTWSGYTVENMRPEFAMESMPAAACFSLKFSSRNLPTNQRVQRLYFCTGALCSCSVRYVGSPLISPTGERVLAAAATAPFL